MGLYLESRQSRAIYLLFLITGHEIQKIHAITHSLAQVTKDGQYGDSSDVAYVAHGVDKIVYERGLLSSQRARIAVGDSEAQTSGFDVLDRNGDGSVSQHEYDVLDRNDDGFVSRHEYDQKQKEDIVGGRSSDPDTNANRTKFASLFSGPFGACGCAAGLAFLTFVAQHYFDNDCQKGYTLLTSNSPSYWLMSMVAILYWIAMPVVLFDLGYSASCGAGVPNHAYKIYGVFFFAQASIVLVGYWMGMKIAAPFLSLSNIMGSLSTLIGLSCLENFDIATDIFFPGSVKACSHHTTAAWLESWRQAYWGKSLLPVLEALQFDGFALTLFVAASYIPQFLVMCPVASLPCFIVLTVAICLWVTVSQLLGFLIMTLGFACYIGLIIVFGQGAPLLSSLCTYTQTSEGLAHYCNILLFVFGRDDDAKSRLLFVSGTKLVFENILQLWVQASSFSLSFELLDSSGRSKALLSMGLGIFVFIVKWMQIMNLIFVEVYIENTHVSWRAKIVVGLLAVLPLIVLGLGPWLWVIAKIYFAYNCESHIWNLSTFSCVQI